MANPEHLQILQQGVVAWNQWRDRHRDITPYLPEANLSGADLRGVDLTGVDLSEATLTGALFDEPNQPETKDEPT